MRDPLGQFMWGKINIGAGMSIKISPSTELEKKSSEPTFKTTNMAPIAWSIPDLRAVKALGCSADLLPDKPPQIPVMNIKTLVIFLLVTAVIIFGVTRIPKFEDPFQAREQSRPPHGTMVSERESKSENRSLLRKRNRTHNEITTGKAESKQELQVELETREQDQLAQLTAILNADPEAAYFYDQSALFRRQMEEIANSSGMAEIKQFLGSGTTDEQNQRAETYQEILDLIRIPVAVRLAEDPDVRNAMETAFEVDKAIQDDVTTWVQAIDELVGAEDEAPAGTQTDVTGISFDWMIANLQDKSVLVQGYIDQALKEYGFPESTKETLNKLVYAETLSGVMSENLILKEPRILQLEDEIQTIRDRLASAPD